MLATPVPNAVSITDANRLPRAAGQAVDVYTLQVAYDGTFAGYMALPVALVFEGDTYGRSSHNSDTMRVTYRTDKPYATKG